VLGNGIGAAGPSLPDVRVPQLSTEEQEAAFTAMPLIKRASSLLEWLGTGKEVTATGALRLKDIEPAAAAVEVQARGKRGARSAVAHNEVDGPLEVSTMFDVPVLREIWTALVGAGLITLSSTRAVPGPAVAAWNSAKREERLDMRRVLAVVLLVRVISEADDIWDRDMVSETLCAVLAYGTTDDPLPVAQLESLAALDPDGPSPEDSELTDPELSESGLEKSYASFAALAARQRLSLLTELGLVETGADYRVRPVAIECVDLALRFLDPAPEPADGVEEESNVVPLQAPSQAARPPKSR
jgi:hypothetical protein